MAGISISCARGDGAVAARIGRGLAALGLPAAAEGEAPAAVLALWTPASINSDVVWDEAGAGQKRGVLVNLLWGVAEPPFLFGAVNGIAMDGWQGGAVPHAGWQRLAEGLEALGLAPPATLTQALLADEAEARRREAAVAAEADPARREMLRAELDGWSMARGAPGDAEDEAPSAPAMPARTLSLFIPAEKLALAGAAPVAVSAPVAGADAALDRLVAEVTRALAAGADGRPLAHVVASPLRPVVVAPVVVPVAAPVAVAPAATRSWGMTMVLVLLAAALAIAAAGWFVVRP